MKEDFKNIIKQTIDNHSEDINPEMIWSGIEDKIGQKKKRFGGYWIFGGLSLFFFLFAMIFILNSKEVDQELNVVNVVAKEVQLSESERVKVTQNATKYEEKDIPINDIISTEYIDGNNSKLIEVESTKKSEFNLEIPNNEFNEVVENLSQVFQEDLPQNNFIAKKQNAKNGLSLIIENDNTEIKRDIEDENFYKVLDLLQLGDRDIALLILPDREVLSAKFEPSVFDVPVFNEDKKFRFFQGVEVFSGLNIGSKSISDVDQSYAQLRNDTEALLEQWNLGMRLDLIKVMDFNITSGIKYSMITDRMLKVDRYDNLLEYSIVTSKLIDDAIVSMDTLMVVDSTAQNLEYITEQFNSQRIVSIPLEMSFGKRFNKFNVGLGFGVDLNYQLKDTHVILDEKGKAVVNGVGGKWIDPSFSGALLLGYAISDRWAISSRINFTGLSFNDHEIITTLRSKYTLYGLEVGLKHYFGK